MDNTYTATEKLLRPRAELVGEGLEVRAELEGGEGEGREDAIAGCPPEQKSDRPLDGTSLVTCSVGGSMSVPLPKLVTTPVTSARKPCNKESLSVPVQVEHAG
jgi:hypothetical protein